MKKNDKLNNMKNRIFKELKGNWSEQVIKDAMETAKWIKQNLIVGTGGAFSVGGQTVMLEFYMWTIF